MARSNLAAKSCSLIELMAIAESLGFPKGRQISCNQFAATMRSHYQYECERRWNADGG
jgi:hypothetical protein